MENETIPNEEYETQFFGYSPSDLCEGVKGIITDGFEDALNKLESRMKMIPQDILSEKEFSEGMEKLRSATRENNAKALLKLKQHLVEKVMKIPPNLLLPEDVEQSANYSAAQCNILKEEVKQLQTQLKAEKFIEASLEEELKDVEVVLEAQKNLLESELSATNLSALEFDKEKLMFFIGKSNQMLESLEMFEKDRDLEKAVNERFEMNIYQ